MHFFQMKVIKFLVLISKILNNHVNIDVAFVTRSCSKIQIPESCDMKVINRRILKVCYVQCSKDGCNNANKLKLSYYFLVFFFVLLI